MKFATAFALLGALVASAAPAASVKRADAVSDT
jgi:hypothetical protein